MRKTKGRRTGPVLQGALSIVQRASAVCLGLAMLVVAIRQPARSQLPRDILMVAASSQAAADHLDKVA